MQDPLDGRIGEAWSGEVPDGSHINVVLARRGFDIGLSPADLITVTKARTAAIAR